MEDIAITITAYLLVEQENVRYHHQEAIGYDKEMELPLDGH